MPQFTLKLTLFLALLGIVSCKEQTTTSTTSIATFKELRSGVESDPYDSVRRFTLAHPSGRIIKTVLLVTAKEQEVGLSGTKDHEFAENEGALFWYQDDNVKGFWMPDTYFNLDLVFLDGSLKIIDIDRNLQAHPGRAEPPAIQFSKRVRARHVLEVKANSPFATVLKIGDQLKVLPPLSLSQIESEIRQKQ